MITKLWRALRAAPLWVKALESVAQKDYTKAKATLNEMTRFIDASDPEFRLLWSLVEYRLGNFPEAHHELRLAREHILASQKYSSDDKNYLLCYSDRLLDKLERVCSIRIDTKYLGDFNAVELHRVTKGIKLNFPL